MPAEKGDWVRIRKILLTPEERAPQVPEDTQTVPLEMWEKGFLLNGQARIGDLVEIETIIGRKVTGTLLEKNPGYDHAWGRCIPEILPIGLQVRQILREEQSDE